MKKLMIAVAIVCAATLSQAAAMKWSTGAMKDATGAASTSKNTTAMLYVLSDAQYSAFTTAIASMDAEAISKYVYDNYNGKAGGIKSSAFSKNAATMTDPATYSANDTAYAVILFTSIDGDGNVKAAMGNYGSYTFEEDKDKTQAGMGLKLQGSGAATAWAAVPEPTSGLLLLLGVAGLALRRRRA